jgi:LacI family transcriptional regulator
LIWFPVNDEGQMRADAIDKPIVVLDRNLPGFDQVHAEYAEGGRLAGEHLVALGHRRIGLLNGPGDVLNSRQRADGVRAALTNSAEICWSLEHPYVPELTAQALELMARKEVTAIACGNDLIALGAMAALRDLGLAPGKDVSVIGFDDIELCRLVWPRLSSVRLPIAEMGAAAVERLMARIKRPDLAAQKVLLGVSLSVRESTASVTAKTRRSANT